MGEKKFNYEQWEKYRDQLWLLRSMALSEWEHEFIFNAWRSLGDLSPGQVEIVEKLISKHFGPQRKYL
jgi:hypothetical protein